MCLVTNIGYAEAFDAVIEVVMKGVDNPAASNIIISDVSIPYDSVNFVAIIQAMVTLIQELRLYLLLHRLAAVEAVLRSLSLMILYLRVMKSSW